MAAAIDILKTKRKEIRNHIFNNRMDEALKLLVEFTEEFYDDWTDDAFLLSRQYYQWVELERLGKMALEEFVRSCNKIASRILDLVKDIIGSIKSKAA
ncbi:MAG: hypothetical protein AAFV80_22195 [Bacteroidota bacterium]